MFTTLQQTHHVSRIRHSRWVHISGGFNGIVQTQASSAVLSEDCDDFVFIYRAISEEEKKKYIYNLFREAQSNCQGTILAAELQSALSAQRQLFTGRAWMHFEVQPFLKSQAHSLERERERGGRRGRGRASGDLCGSEWPSVSKPMPLCSVG